MKIGDKVIVKHRGIYGTVVTKPTKILNEICVGVKFDDPVFNELYDPYYCHIDTLEVC